jgi:hypothetical protein
MMLVTAVGLGLSGLFCLALGGRLLLLSRHTRGAPEFFWGLAWFLAAIENALWALGVAVSAGPLHLLLRWGVACVYPAVVIALMIANWRLFRPDCWWAKAACVGIAVALAIVWVLETAVIGLDVPMFSTKLSLLGFADDVGLTLGFLWAAIETGVHYRTFNRRSRIGLAPRFLAVRYLLWFGSSSILLLYWLMLWSRYVVATPTWFLDTSLPILMLASVLLMWVTFFPPRSLRRHFETEAAS